MATLNFDANQVEPNREFEPIPAGKYLAVITESEMKDTKAGGGQYLQLTFQILDGPFKGRFLWSRLNLDNANATTVKIAKGELSAVCRAVGVMSPQDSTELHNLPLLIHVKCRKRDDTGEIVNEIKGCSKKESSVAASPTAASASPTTSAAAPAGAPSQAANSTPPWRR